MRASGVYFNITDNSIKTAGGSSFSVIVPMLTQKGVCGGFTRVTANDYEDLLGADLSYNPNFLGLKTILESLSYADVWRINAEAKVANLYDEAGGTITTEADLSEGETVEDAATTFYIQAKTAGVRKEYIRISKVSESQEIAVPETPATKISFGESVSLDSEVFTLNGTKYVASILNSDGVTVRAVAKATGEVHVIKADGTVGDKIGTLEADGVTLNEGEGFSALNITGSVFYVDAWIPENKMYSFTVATLKGSVYNKVTEVTFSLDANSSVYFDKLSYGDYDFFVKNTTSPEFDLLADYTIMQSGDNGRMPFVSELDLSAFDLSPATAIVMNGITDISVVNAIAKKAESLYKVVFVDAPAFTKYSSVVDWAKSVYSSEYVVVGWICDIVETEIGEVFVYPSVNYVSVYANMLGTYGYTNYPPAGATYGNIAITKLQETDAHLYRDELKTNKINYQRVLSNGAVIWEQRTRYGLESDLAYVAPVFIINDLRTQLVSFAQNFNFRYTDSAMLIVFEQGIRNILTEFTSNSFLSKWSIDVPTFEEAQASGRTFTVKISVAVTQDSEEIVFDLNLENFENVG